LTTWFTISEASSRGVLKYAWSWNEENNLLDILSLPYQNFTLIQSNM